MVGWLVAIGVLVGSGIVYRFVIHRCPTAVELKAIQFDIDRGGMTLDDAEAIAQKLDARGGHCADAANAIRGIARARKDREQNMPPAKAVASNPMERTFGPGGSTGEAARPIFPTDSSISTAGFSAHHPRRIPSERW